jgi:hypothetical protein
MASCQSATVGQAINFGREIYRLQSYTLDIRDGMNALRPSKESAAVFPNVDMIEEWDNLGSDPIMLEINEIVQKCREQLERAVGRARTFTRVDPFP